MWGNKRTQDIGIKEKPPKGGDIWSAAMMSKLQDMKCNKEINKEYKSLAVEIIDLMNFN